MCGIAGLAGVGDGSDATALVRGMTASVSHRGPDAEGHWAGDSIVLGFRRLAILDLSPCGEQPMVSASGRYVLVFNGEIYNFGELRAELVAQGATFRGHSDTEVLLQGIDTWGLPQTLERANGMFAFAVWDRHRRVLTLARDRMGEKPLYYGSLGGRTVFASEMKALQALPGATPDVDRSALTLFMRFGYVPAPYSILAGIHQVPPGTTVEFGGTPLSWGVPVPYWSARHAALRGLADPFTGTPADAADAVHTLLAESIRLRMVADVPVGAFLSGGIDSSLIIALMQASSDRAVRTFSIGFDQPEYDEARHARAVSDHLGTDHTELYVTADQALDVIPRLPDIYDEPFADSSQIPTLLVSELARRDVTVALSGDGADELFGGYVRYLHYGETWRRLSRIPAPVRRAAAAALLAVPEPQWDSVGRRLGRGLPRRLAGRRVGASMHKLAGALPVTSPTEAYHRLASHWDRPETVVIGGEEPLTAFTDPHVRLDGAGSVETCMYLDAVSYLPNDILTKVDRASMAVSLEVRIPFLDHRLVELAWSLPLDCKIVDGRGKAILRDLLARYVPVSLTDRPKMGFGVPLGSWLRGPLREWGEELLGAGRLRHEGFLEAAPVRAAWNAHQGGAVDLSDPLWDVLTFQSWLERWGRRTATTCD